MAIIAPVSMLNAGEREAQMKKNLAVRPPNEKGRLVVETSPTINVRTGADELSKIWERRRERWVEGFRSGEEVLESKHDGFDCSQCPKEAVVEEFRRRIAVHSDSRRKSRGGRI